MTAPELPGPAAPDPGGTLLPGPWPPSGPAEAAGDAGDGGLVPFGALGDVLTRPAGAGLDEARPRGERVGWGRFTFTGGGPWVPYRVRDVAGPAAGQRLPRRVVRALARAVWRVLQGHRLWARRAFDAATYAAMREQVRAARAAGNTEALGEWLDRLHAAKLARWQRVAGLPGVLRAVALTAAAGVGGGAGVLVAGGVVVAATRPDGWTWAGYWSFLAAGGHVAAVAGIVGMQVAAYGALPAWLAAAWRAGKSAGTVPGWLAVTGRVDLDGEPITPSIVVAALRDLGISALRKAIREMGDAGAGMLGPIVLAGCGVEVDVLLPRGVDTLEVSNRRRKLAENLSRHEHELFITIPAAARTVRLWIADSGALDEPIGPSPLVIDPDLSADMYTGRAPWGQDLRGDAALLSLKQRHMLVTGLSNQGKTAAVRALALWLALDPTVELRIADLKGAGDWRMFDGLATVLIEGPTDEHVIAVTEMVEEAVREMERRIVELGRSGATNGVTRDMARAGTGFHPLTVIVDEAQVAFMCPAVGDDKRPYGGTKATSRYFMACRKLHNQGRAVNVTLWQGTQDPTDQNLPKLVREGAHIRASLVVGTEAQARMALGDKAVNSGAAPHKLRQGLDKGTLVVTGDGVTLPPGQSSLTIRSHFIDGDPAVMIAGRAKALRARTLTRTTAAIEPPAGRDHLTDIDTVMRGEKRVRTQVVLTRLTELDTAYYEDWTFQDLAAALDAHGLEARKSDGNKVIRAEDIRQAITERDGGEEGGR